jgi:predicted NAD/FAD-binding protein
MPDRPMPPLPPRRKIAVIGTGIAGMSCAWLLNQGHDITVYEAGARPGGHAHTVMVEGESGSFPVDIGFIVYNEPTYPNLTALFALLGVPTQDSDMSFAASLQDGRLEYAGTGLRGLFAQRRNLIRPRFWSMLRDLRRLYAQAPRDSVMNDPDLISLGDWLDQHGYGQALQRDHLLPMAAAIWSSRAGAVRDYPAAAFFRFCDNHGLLRLTDRPLWRTVSGGSQAYVARLTAPYAARIRSHCAISGIRRSPAGVVLRGLRGEEAQFDDVVLATHAGQALSLLEDADAQERELLGAFAVSRNLAVLHTDESLMPKRRGVWASWNFLGGMDDNAPPCVTYWMNLLQNLPTRKQVFVTLNPLRPPSPEKIILTQAFDHPLFDVGAMRAQRRIWSIQGRRRTWFCGAWFGAGFHEDGVQAGLAVAEALGGLRRPWSVANESGRIHLGAAATRAPGQAAA